MATARYAQKFLCFLTLISCVYTKAAEGRVPMMSPNDDQSSAGTTQATTSGGQKVWCVGKPAAEDMYLRGNIDFACGEGDVDCSLIQPGGACFLPNTPIAHASYAMNLYYQKSGRNWWNCHFNNTGLVVFTDPSFGDCKYLAQWTL